LYTLWNPASEAEDLLATLHYGTAGAAYKMPLHLEPYASQMIDIGELIRTRALDQDGNTLPLDAGQGSVVLSSPAAAPEDLINVVFAGGIYNPRKATCGQTCEVCNGFTGLNLDPANASLAVGGQRQYRFSYTWFDGSQHDVTNSSNWSSSQPSIASVQTTGQTDPGLTDGQDPGGPVFVVTVYGTPIPENVGQICTPPGFLPPCATAPQIEASGSATVQAPGSVAVVSAGNPYCDDGNPFGIKISIVYQLYDQSSPPQVMAVAGMIPCETITQNGTVEGPEPLSANPTTAQGQFADSPFGACAPAGPFSIQIKQQIQMQAPGANPPKGPCTDPAQLSGVIRTNNWTITGGMNGSAGEITNGGDIDVKRN
jgi:hypothetical protein